MALFIINKKIMRAKILLIIFLLTASASPALALSESLIINELAWMGTTNSSNDEWIELYNPTSEEIPLSGWTLSWDGGEINLEGTVKAESFFLLERTDDDSVPNQKADQIYVGSLGNSGESLTLKNNSGSIIDSASFAVGWPYGNNEQKNTMERKCTLENGNLDSSWQDSLLAGGTPAAENNCDPKPPVCAAIEINRNCVADGKALITYNYQDNSCGEEFTQEENDQACLCSYTDWSDQACSADGLREQTREELNGFSYCQANLTREVEDLSCSLDKITTSGKGCWVEEKKWICDSETVITADKKELLVEIPSKNFSKNFKITDSQKLYFYYIYQAKLNNIKFILIVNTQTKNVIGFGNQVYFTGKIK